MHSPDSTHRFSDRVENYVHYRPTYPEDVLEVLRQGTGLRLEDAIADIGSGTGISAEQFLRNGNQVFGVEPNLEMRQAAESQLHQYAKFHSIVGTAEATTLPNHSVDYVVAAQAFHWFDQAKAKQEFVRILRPRGWAVLIWNFRRTDSTAFLRGYEALLQQYGTDYKEIRHNNIKPRDLEAFFGGSVEGRSSYNEQLFDFDGLKGRLLSSSYTPNPAHPNFQPMIQALKRIFEQYQEGNKVR
ncbi:MAG: class I SAM-dependent methyltransferase, partial [Phormidesmis sp.]